MKSHLTGMGETMTTKERIMLEAAMLFSHRGFADVSISEIANRVKIKPASIYHHFEGKEALYKAILKNIESIYRTSMTDSRKIYPGQQTLSRCWTVILRSSSMFITSISIMDLAS